MLRLYKILLFLALLTPLLVLIFDILYGNIIDPIEEITNPTGQWALRFVILSLTITPLVILLNKPYLIRFRKMIGLFAFFYMCLHLGIWLLDKTFTPELMLDDITQRTYIIIGFIAFILTMFLAITSTKGWIRRLGKKWKTLHRLNYLIVVLAWLHLLLQSKSGWDYEIMNYLLIIIILFGIRIFKNEIRRVA